MTFLKPIRDCLDALLHHSVRHDALTSARHRAFIAPRLLGSLAAFAAFPAYLAMRGAPTAIEVGVFAWLVAPILMSLYLSRTGRYESAHILSSLALASLIVTVATATGGIHSFAAIWLVLIPVEASLSASRRVVAVSSALAIACVCILIGMGRFGWLPVSVASGLFHGVLTGFGIASATIYAAGLAFGAESLTRASVALLYAEEDRYRMLAQNMSDVISRHRANGAVQFISPAGEALTGVALPRLLGQGLFDRVHVADRPAYLKALSDAARGEAECSVEFRLRRDSRNAELGRNAVAEFVWAEMRCRPLERAADIAASPETEVVAVIRDISQRKAQEQALEVARNAAQQADAAKSRFLATMSHELRTPLNAIIGFSEMLMQEDVLMVNAASRKEYAQLINGSGQHLLSVVNGILDMSKIENGNYEISPEPFAVRPALVTCCDLMALKARENGVEVVARAPDDLPEMLGDPRAFKQIALNLISNAVKFSERGGMVTASVAVDGSRLMLRVADNGVGIASADIGRIGEAFFQAGTTYQRRHEGTGLGLSIVKSLVALQGGEMTVQSKLDEGTTVTIALPLIYTPKTQKPQSNIATLTSAMRPGQQETFKVKKSA